MMTRELGSRVDRLEDGRRRFLLQLGQLPPQARGWRAHRSAWSPLEVAHHLALVESLTTGGFRRASFDSGTERRLRHRIGSVILAIIFRFRIRVAIPTERVRPDPTLTFNEVRATWDEHRDSLLDHLRAVDPAQLGTPILRHPVAGPMTYLEGLDFLVSHQEHHISQLDRIRSHPNFPWNA